MDDKANRIGALVRYFTATEKLYQFNTFDSIGIEKLDTANGFKNWAVPMDLGAPASASIKGHPARNR